MKQFFIFLFSLVCISTYAGNVAPAATVTTSYVSPWETLTSVNDGFTPASSGDRDHGVYGNWNNPNTVEWVQYGWDQPYAISKIDIYWFEDGGGVLVPDSAYLQYWNGSAWVSLGIVGTAKDAFNTLTFASVTTDSLRISMKNTLQSTGIIEWQVEGTPTQTGTPAGGKKVYIPTEWKDPNNNIQWDSTNRCRQSANFALFWGPIVGNDPTQETNPDLRFDPQFILDSMEDVYADYITKWHMLPDSGSLAKYKIIIVMNNTWRDGLYTGWLFGGGFNNIIGAMFIDPRAGMSTDTWGLSHEFTHACQYMITFCMYPGHGFSDAHSGFFWETHAQFMAWQRLPAGLGNADQSRELNFTNYTMSSARKHYANLYYLELLKDKYGIDFVSRIWREADQANHEHPFQTIQRLLGTGQAGINAMFMEHAMRNVDWDYGTQSSIRPFMNDLKANPLVNWHATNILDSLGTDHYAIPDGLAPQQYGYNIVQLFVKDSSCSQPYVHIKFKGHVDANAGSGWLYGFVSIDANGVSSYSSQYSDSEIAYKFPAGAKQYYMVVMGAPTAFRVHKDLYEIGFPKEFRYAWEVHLTGMVPDGYQKNFINTAGVTGAPHPNGGGFVASTAKVAATAYVGPHAAVLGSAQVTGNAKVLDKAMVGENATISDNAIVSGFARVIGASVIKQNAKVTDRARVGFTNLSDSSVISGNAAANYDNISGGSVAGGNLFSWGGTLSGGGQFGGDAELFSPCGSAGKYLQVGGLSLRPGGTPRQFCDGSFDNILNVDTNAVYTPFSDSAMAFGKSVQCGEIVGSAVPAPTVNAGPDQTIMLSVGVATVTGTAASTSAIVTSTQWVQVSGPAAVIADFSKLTTAINFPTTGVYQFALVATDNFNSQARDTVTITVLKANEPPVTYAGADITITLPDDDATITGTATDPDDVVQAVVWTQLSGPSNAYIVSPGSLSSVVDRLVQGTYEFVLTATDKAGLTGGDTVVVTVKPAGTGLGTVRITAPTLFPIPASDRVTVSYPATIGGVLSVYDVKGAKVLSVTVPSNSTTTSFSVKGLIDGVYFVRIDTYSHDMYKMKMIVAH